MQYKEARRNISVGSVIFVHDFAQNYLCEQQNKVQGLHWIHKQVTLMPTVAHYCVKCEQLVTHEIVHITDDLKHDAHLVKLFTSKSIEVLKANNVDICKMIEFMDQAPPSTRTKLPSTTWQIPKCLHRGIILVPGVAKALVMLVLGGQSKVLVDW